MKKETSYPHIAYSKIYNGKTYAAVKFRPSRIAGYSLYVDNDSIRSGIQSLSEAKELLKFEMLRELEVKN